MNDHASLFDRVRAQDDDSQIAQFLAASHDIPLGGQQRAEFSLEATPAYCPKAGLHLSIDLSIYLCEPDDCQLLARAQLTPQESLLACADKSPIRAALRARPECLREAIEECPQLGPALDARLAKREKRLLAQAAPAPEKKAARRM